MNSNQFYGVHTALVTPMRGADISWEDTDRLLDHQLAGKIDGLVAVGTTGESPTLDHSEHIAFVKHVAERCGGQVPVIAGTGSNSTREAVDLTGLADKAGADAMLVVAPYYNKPSPAGLLEHFSAIAEATRKPIILYSIPSRCGIEISIPVIEQLHQRHPHVIGIKEAGGSCERVSQINQAMGDDFLILSGDDSLTLPFMAAGAKGVISVASNLIPGEMVKMVGAALNNDFASAIQEHKRLYHLFKTLFIEPNPVPVKQALVETGLIQDGRVRRPLCAMTDENLAVLRDCLRALNLT